MRNIVCGPLLLMLQIALLQVGFSNTACADWTDTFSGGTTDQFWQFGSDGGDAGTFLGGQVINDELVLTASSAPSAGGAETGFGVVITEVFSDVRMSGIMNPSGNGNINDSIGLLFRGNTVNQTFYMAEVNYTSAELIIYRNNPGVDGGNSNLSTASIPNLDFTDSLYVELEAIGTQLEAWAYTDATKATLLANTSFNDDTAATLTSGLSGVLVNENFGGLPMLGIWDDISATSVSTGVPSDFDGDDDVDGADFMIIQQEFGITTTSQDITDWESNYPVPLSASIQAIPEPTSLVMAGALLLLLGSCSRRG
jgi:hypothetical protein